MVKRDNALELPSGAIQPQPNEPLLSAAKRLLRGLMGLKIDKEANVEVFNYITWQEHRVSDKETAKWTTYDLEVLFEDMRFLSPGTQPPADLSALQPRLAWSRRTHPGFAHRPH